MGAAYPEMMKPQGNAFLPGIEYALHVCLDLGNRHRFPTGSEAARFWDLLTCPQERVLPGGILPPSKKLVIGGSTLSLPSYLASSALGLG